MAGAVGLLPVFGEPQLHGMGVHDMMDGLVWYVYQLAINNTYCHRRATSVKSKVATLKARVDLGLSNKIAHHL